MYSINMTFSVIDRGILEELFNFSISDMKTVVELTRDDIFHNILNDKDGVDLALGLSLGNIHTSFIVGFRQRKGRILDSGERKELLGITLSKLPQLKEAIFQCG